MPAQVGFSGGQARAFGVALDRAALGVRQVLGQPGVALRQGLGVGGDDLDAFQRIGAAQQVVADQQADLAHDVAGRVAEHVQRAVDHALGGVLNADHAVLGAACGRGVEDFLEGVAVQEVGGAAEVLHGGFFGERAFRAEHGHALGRFQRQAGRT